MNKEPTNRSVDELVMALELATKTLKAATLDLERKTDVQSDSDSADTIRDLINTPYASK